MSTVFDSQAREIEPGARVRVIGYGYGARLADMDRAGTVGAIGKTRARVDLDGSGSYAAEQRWISGELLRLYDADAKFTHGAWTGPTASHAGSSKARQEVGLPGHCEPCAAYGHVRAHPELGCADVGCDSAHPDTSPEIPVVTKSSAGASNTPQRGEETPRIRQRLIGCFLDLVPADYVSDEARTGWAEDMADRALSASSLHPEYRCLWPDARATAPSGDMDPATRDAALMPGSKIQTRYVTSWEDAR